LKEIISLGKKIIPAFRQKVTYVGKKKKAWHYQDTMLREMKKWNKSGTFDSKTPLN